MMDALPDRMFVLVLMADVPMVGVWDTVKLDISQSILRLP